jgi:opacity protein-like surface antigen
MLCAAHAFAQSPVVAASGESPVTAAGDETPVTAARDETPVIAARGETPVIAVRSKNPVAAARGKSIDVGLGYSYVSHGESHSNRVALRGADASFTIGASRLGLRVDLGYARAGNVLGTGRHSDVLSYLAGPVVYPTRHRNFDTYIHVLVGGARVTGPVLLNGGGFLIGGWATGYAWAVGGGADYWLSDSMAIRTGVDYMRTAYFDPSLATRGQSNMRATAMVVYFFGRRSKTWR